MIRISSNIPVFLILLFCTQNVLAIHPEEGLEFTSSLTQFDFSEFENGPDMNLEESLNESGLLYGGNLKAKKAFDNVYMQLSGGISFGRADYTGRTSNSDEVHLTTTDETIEDWSISLGKIYESWRRHDYAVLYAGAGWHRWKRDIATTKNASGNDVIGLLELYTWLYVHVGARGHLLKMGPVRIQAELNLLRTMFPYMDVSYRGAYDSSKVKLGEHYGARLALPVRIELSRSVQFLLEPYLEAWDLGRSEHVTLTAQGFYAGGTHEPQSKTRLYGMNMGFAVRFD